MPESPYPSWWTAAVLSRDGKDKPLVNHLNGQVYEPWGEAKCVVLAKMSAEIWAEDLCLL